MKKRPEKKEGSKKPTAIRTRARVYETMSQSQNRHGKGRQRNGSDGSAEARGSNH